MLARVRERLGRPAARAITVVLAWLAAAGVATLAGMLAVGAIGSGIISAGAPPLSDAEVSRLLAQPTVTVTSAGSPAPPATSAATSGAPTGGSGEAKVLGSPGGTVIARCAPGAEIVSSAPAQGYQVKDVEPEDGGMRVRFESGHSRVELTVTCVAGIPQASTRVDG